MSRLFIVFNDIRRTVTVFVNLRQSPGLSLNIVVNYGPGRVV